MVKKLEKKLFKKLLLRIQLVVHSLGNIKVLFRTTNKHDLIEKYKK